MKYDFSQKFNSIFRFWWSTYDEIMIFIKFDHFWIVKIVQNFYVPRFWKNTQKIWNPFFHAISRISPDGKKWQILALKKLFSSFIWDYWVKMHHYKRFSCTFYMKNNRFGPFLQNKGHFMSKFTFLIKTKFMWKIQSCPLKCWATLKYD